MKRLYIIAGPNGAGKTTASYTILPEIFDCHEFVNADEIARGISPLNPSSVHIQAGRVMLNRIEELLTLNLSFAIETTLATRSFRVLIQKAQAKNYQVVLLFLALKTEELAVHRVKIRVKEGGHHIPEPVIRRRFKAGLRNFFNLYLPAVDSWLFIDNSREKFQVVAKGNKLVKVVSKSQTWESLIKTYHEN